MAIRRIKYQLEAKLEGKSSGLFSSNPKGKIERKTYEDGTERLKIKVSNLKVADDVQATIYSNKVELTRITIRDGRGKFDEETSDSSFFPPLEVNQTIEVMINNELLLAGVLYED